MNRIFKHLYVLALITQAYCTCAQQEKLLVFDGRAIVKELWKQPVENIDAFFASKVELLRAFQPEYISLAICEQCVRQCHIVHVYLNHFFISVEKKSLVYTLSSFSEQGYVVLYEHWKRHNFAPFYAFYIFYLDALSRLFVVKAHESYCLGAHTDYAKVYAQAEQLYHEMSSIIQIFEGSGLAARYAQKLTCYCELLQFVQATREKNG